MKKQQNTIWYQHEALDRVSMILSHVDSALGYTDNPHYGIYNKKCKKLLVKVYKNLSDLYQAVGEWEHKEEN